MVVAVLAESAFIRACAMHRSTRWSTSRTQRPAQLSARAPIHGGATYVHVALLSAVHLDLADLTSAE
jgi:hypothetical protein